MRKRASDVEEPPAGEQRWQARPLLAALLKGVVIAIPVMCSLLAAWALSAVLPAGSGASRWGYRAITVGCSVAAALVAERGSRRLVPLTVLLKLSMLFPDQAPSRFKVARRATSKHGLDRLASRRDGAAANAASTIMELLAALAHHDKRTRGHAERVRVYTDLLGEQLRLTRFDQDRLRWAALLHDVGKLAVDPAILNKPGKPSEREWAILRSHPEAGAKAAADLLPWLGEWGSAIAEHHERFDGTGYPSGLDGLNISRAGRMLAVVDAYEVITAARSYKRPTSTMKAREELARCAGSHFDPAIVRAFLAISLPRLIWATGPLSFLVQLPFMGVLRDAGTKVASASGPAVAAAAGVVVVATTAAPSHHSATQIAQPARTIVTTRPLPPVHVAPPAPQKKPAPHVLAIASTVDDPPPPPFAKPVQATPQAPVVPTPPAAAPLVTVTSGPVASSSATDATVTFDVSDPTASVTCSLDGAAPAPCSGSWNAADLTVGNHTLTITATNAGGTGTASYGWTVTAPPPPPVQWAPADVVITSAPVPSTAATDATVDFTVSDPAATTTCSLDGATFSACTTPFTATNLPPGNHTLTIAATNAGGVRTTSYSWTVVAAPVAAPTVFVISGPVPSTSAVDATITFAVSDPAAAVVCSLDGAPSSACANPWTATNLGVGSHTLTVTASNAGGTGSASYTWTITPPPPPPVGAPTVTVDSGPQLSGTATDAAVVFSVSDPTAVVTCSVDGGPPTSCASPWTATNLAIGSHTLTISATNAGGTGTAGYTWTIVPVPVAAPTVTVTSGPLVSTSATDATIGFTVSDPAATIVCSLNGAPVTPCSSPWTATALATGVHTLTITATNAGGTGTASYSWTVTAPPAQAVTLILTPPVKTSAKTATFAWIPLLGLTYQCSLDGAPFTPCASPVIYSGLRPATHTFRVHSVNSLGGVSADTTFSWRVT